MKTNREIKAAAREMLLGRYLTVILARILMRILQWLSVFACIASLLAALVFAGLGLLLPVPFVWMEQERNALLMGLASCAFAFFLLFCIFFGKMLEMGYQQLLLHMCRSERYGYGDLFRAFYSGNGFLTYFGCKVAVWFLTQVLLGIPELILHIWMTVMQYSLFDPKTPLSVMVAAGSLRMGIAFLRIVLLLMYSMSMFCAIEHPGSGIRGALRHSRDLMRGRKLKYLGFQLSFLPWMLVAVICPLAGWWIHPYIDAADVIFYMDTDGTAWQVPERRTIKASEPQDKQKPLT